MVDFSKDNIEILLEEDAVTLADPRSMGISNRYVEIPKQLVCENLLLVHEVLSHLSTASSWLVILTLESVSCTFSGNW